MSVPNDLKYWVALNNFQKFGPVRTRKLAKTFPDMESAFKARAQDLTAAGLEPNLVNEFLAARQQIDPDSIMARLDKEGIRVITWSDTAYPKLLSEIFDPPPLLYIKGELAPEDEYSLAVVGARKYSAYGRQVTEKLVKEVAGNRMTIVSGMALGIDALAHTAALEAGGRTLGVLATGLDKQSIYPAANRYLADRIIANRGALISEFAPDTPGLRHHFPQRNRVISGLCLGTLVIEAGAKSGSLITAGYAAEQNREVFAVPGNIYSPVSTGTNNLIKQGARPVSSGSEILEALDLRELEATVEAQKTLPETEEEKLISQYLCQEPIYIDELVKLTKLDTAKINSTLIIMEMKGLAKNIGNMRYVIGI